MKKSLLIAVVVLIMLMVSTMTAAAAKPSVFRPTHQADFTGDLDNSIYDPVERYLEQSGKTFHSWPIVNSYELTIVGQDFYTPDGVQFPFGTEAPDIGHLALDFETRTRVRLYYSWYHGENNYRLEGVATYTKLKPPGNYHLISDGPYTITLRRTGEEDVVWVNDQFDFEVMLTKL